MDTTFIKNGGALIAEQIAAAVRDGSRTTTVTGNYEIEQTILIPSDFTLILDNCHLRMADDTFCNMFTNEHCRTEIGHTIEGTDRNIIIEGRGRATLDGGNYNGLSEKNCLQDGRPHISVNNLILFTNVEHFSVSGIKVCNQRWWALNFVFCRFGHIHDIDICSDDTYVDENGVHHQGLFHRPEEYKGVYIKNSDGIDLRAGCHDIRIENITGFTEDDTIALTGLWGRIEREFFVVEGLPTDIYNVSIRNVNAAAYCAIIRLLNQSGIKLYNILIDGVMDSSAGCPHIDRTTMGVRVGDQHLYGERHSTPDETYNITIRNVFTRAYKGVVLAGAIRNLVTENINGFDGCGLLMENHATID